MKHSFYPTLCFAMIPFVALSADFEDRATRDWGGARSQLEEAGVSVDVTYKADVVANISGGVKRGTRALDNLDVVFNFDGEKLVGAEGLSATVHFLNNNGGRPDADLVQSAQGINNIEVSRATGKLYQAYLQQNYYDDRVSVLAGLYDLNSEFNVTDTSGLFIHPTFGIGTDASQSGVNGPSIFPFTALGARLFVAPTEETYLQAAVLDGVAGDPDRLSGTHQTLDKNDGLLIITELGYAADGRKLALGGWGYTETADHQTDVDARGNPIHQLPFGAYVIGEMPLYEESEGQGLSGFVRVGGANGAVHQFNYAWSAGLVYTGLIPARDEGQLGFGITQAHNGDDFREAAAAAGVAVDAAETTLELTYSDNVTPWLSVQPDVQYIMDTGTNPALDDALILGTRFTVSF
jgi:porin